MIKQLLILFLCIISLYSCSSKNKVPREIIQPVKMGEVLWDVMRVQFMVEEFVSLDSSLTKENELTKFTERVFKMHDVSTNKFNQSYDWYIKHPELFKRILDSLQVQKQRINNTPEGIMDSSEILKMEEKSKKGLQKIMKEEK